MGKLKSVYGKDWVLNYIAAWLLNLSDNSNVKNKMTPAQMDFVAESIYQKYSLRIADLTLFFRYVKEGAYGSYYENLSPEKIMQWMAKYYDDRCEMAQMVSSTSHTEFSTKIDKMHPEVIKKMFDGIGEEPIDHSLETRKGMGSRLRKNINEKIGSMEDTEAKFIEQLKADVKNHNDQDIKKTIERWTVRNDMKRYVSVLEDELESRISN